MTIGIGVMYEEGFILGADTQMNGLMKYGESKIAALQWPEKADSAKECVGRAMFALAGNVAMARMIIEDCNAAIQKLKPEQMTHANMVLQIRKVLIQDFKYHVHSDPRRDRDADPEFIIILWSKKDGIAAYVTEGTAINEMGEFHCIGTGGYLGRYLLTPHAGLLLSPREWAIASVCHALREVKAYDISCGQDSEVCLLQSDGEWFHLHQWSIDTEEQISKDHESISLSVFRMLACAKKKDFQESMKEKFLEGAIREAFKKKWASLQWTSKNIDDVLVFPALKPLTPEELRDRTKRLRASARRKAPKQSASRKSRSRR